MINKTLKYSKPMRVVRLMNHPVCLCTYLYYTRLIYVHIYYTLCQCVCVCVRAHCVPWPDDYRDRYNDADGWRRFLRSEQWILWVCGFKTRYGRRSNRSFQHFNDQWPRQWPYEKKKNKKKRGSSNCSVQSLRCSFFFFIISLRFTRCAVR